MAKIIKTTGEVTTTSPKNGTDFSLEELQAIVKSGKPQDQGFIEIVHVSPSSIMIVNEEGLLHQLPHNPKANKYYPYGVIVGDVLICDSSEVK